jgi:hypothetical protein
MTDNGWLCYLDSRMSADEVHEARVSGRFMAVESAFWQGSERGMKPKVGGKGLTCTLEELNEPSFISKASLWPAPQQLGGE